ncbi:MAG: nuclease-related domain-containing protein [Dehalococcoidia bacterium]|nr:nuclease-related domain-containing protein [Dehalococcoidia bacterium]
MPKVARLRKRRRDYELGRDGEREVGQALEELRQQGYSVFHDVVGDNFNIDHVIVSQRGIFSIETKTYRKPMRGNPKITFNGQRVLKDGNPIDPSPAEQAKANAAWLRCKVLHESTGKWFPVKPVVVFPGWWVEEQNNREMWVLNPDRLPSYIAKEPDILSREDTHLAAYHLSRFIRSIG